MMVVITALKGKIPEDNYSVKKETAIADCIDQLKRRFGPLTERTVELKVLENGMVILGSGTFADYFFSPSVGER